jgi:hypothetical protein
MTSNTRRAATAITALLIPVLAQASALGDLAASMKAGEWKELTTQGLTDDLLLVPPGNLLQYADNGVWDPGSRQFLLIGGAHAPVPNMRFLSYQESTNAWRILQSQDWFCLTDGCVSHPNDHHAIDAAAGVMYYRMFNREVVRKFEIATGTWSALPAMPVKIGVSGGLAYFPELGGLIAAGEGTVELNTKSTQQWTKLSPPEGLPMGGYQSFSEYNPVHKVVIFGGGVDHSEIYKIDPAGKVTKMKNAPYVPSIPYSVETVDPVSGDFIFLRYSTDWVISHMYSYNVVTDVWKELPAPPLATGTGLAAAPVSTHGVMMFLAYDWHTPKVYLYKHDNMKGTPLAAAPSTGKAPGISVLQNTVGGPAVIRFSGQGLVRAGIYDERGRLVSELPVPAQGSKHGESLIRWDSSKVPNGVYVIRADFKERRETLQFPVHR